MRITDERRSVETPATLEVLINKFDSSSDNAQIYPLILCDLCVEDFLELATPH
jgi:hypothetical protein